LKSRLESIDKDRIAAVLLACNSRAGGGSLPLLNLPSRCVGIRINGISANAIERWLRNATPPVIGRIENDQFIMDPRTLQEEDMDIVEKGFRQMLAADVQDTLSP
jgi:L-seryl-tRNA(Ser) seleniumtransferase